MRKSVLFRRMILTVGLSVFAAALLITLLFSSSFLVRLHQIQGEEILPKVQALGDIIPRIKSIVSLDRSVEWITQSERAEFLALMDEEFMFYDPQGNLVGGNLQYEVPSELMAPLVRRALAGETVISTEVLPGDKKAVVGGCPLYRYDGELLGCGFLFADRNVYPNIVRHLLITVPIALLPTLLLSALVIYFLVWSAMRPIRQITDIADAMAAGDFSAQADESAVGEIGEIGRSLNHMNRELARKIDEVTQAHNRLARSVDSLAEGFLSVGPAGNIRYCNQALLNMFKDAPDTADERLRTVPDPGVWDALEDALASGQHRTMRMNRNEQVYQVTISYIEQGGAVALFRDITESERLERTRREYVANVSHELRTPLTAMRALVEPMRDGIVADETARDRYYGIILSEIDRLSHMIDKLMELSRLQSGQVKIVKTRISIRQMLSDMALVCQPCAQQKELRFELCLDDSLPPVFGSEEHLSEVLVILLDNAMKYTPAGGLVRLGARLRGEKVEVFVSDNGVGIAPGDLPYVFDRFYKADKSHSGNGSGLGLSIAKELLAQMGEEIRVVSVLGQGSEFYFTLSRCEDTDSSHRAEISAT